MRKVWLGGLALVGMVGAVAHCSSSDSDGPAEPEGTPTATTNETPTAPAPPSAPVYVKPPPGGFPLALPSWVTVEEMNRTLDQGHTVDQTTWRVVGDESVADFRVQTRLRLAKAKAGSDAFEVPPDFTSGGWNITTPNPVRTTPAAFGQVFGNGQSATDLIGFATDPQENSKAGLTAGFGVLSGTTANCVTGSSNACGKSTQYIVNNIYTTPKIVGYNPSAGSGNLFEIGALMFSFNSSKIQMYSLAFGVERLLREGPGHAVHDHRGPLGLRRLVEHEPDLGRRQRDHVVGPLPSVRQPREHHRLLLRRRQRTSSASRARWPTRTAGSRRRRRPRRARLPTSIRDSSCQTAGSGGNGACGYSLSSGSKLGPPTVLRLSATENVIFTSATRRVTSGASTTTPGR